MLKVCRKHGVKGVSVDTVHIELGDAPIKARASKAEKSNDAIETPDAMSDDDILFWSSAERMNG